MLRVEVDLFGPYTHGVKKGQVNPKAFMSFTSVGDTPVKALTSLKDENGDLPIYKITNITKLN